MPRTESLLTVALFTWLGSAAALAAEPSLPGSATAAVLCAMSAWLWSRQPQALLRAALTFACAGFAISGVAVGPMLARVDSVEPGPARLTLKVLTSPVQNQADAPWMSEAAAPARAHFIAADEEERTWLVGAPAALALLPGERLEASGEVVAFSRRDWDGGFDARTIYGRRGLGARFEISAVELVERRGEASPGTALAARWRHQLAAALVAHGAGGAIVAAIVTGDRVALAPHTERAFAHAGIIHVLSVSGLHLGAAALFFYGFFRLVLGGLMLRVPFSAKRWSAALAVAPALGYAWLTGAELPAVRSGVMVALAFLTLAAARRADARRALALALIALVFTCPTSTLEPGFCFSFATVFALTVWARRTPGAGRVRRWLSGFVQTSLLANAVSWPLSAYFFHQLSIAGLWTNAIAVPLTDLLIVPVGLVWLATRASWAASLLCAAGRWLDALVSATPTWAAPSFSLAAHEVGLALMLLALLATPARARLARVAWVCAACLVSALATPWLTRDLARTPVVHFLPVGQGDGAVIFGEGGQVMVIDAGGDYAGATDPGQRVLVPFLLRHRVFSIDHLVLTHAHPDHFGGMSALLSTFRVGTFWWNGQVGQGPGWRTTLRAALAEAEETRVLGQDGTPTLEGSSLDLLHPRPSEQESYFPELGHNDNSAVLRLEHHGRSVLFAGDVEGLGEEWLSAHAALRADVLKIAHHGSDTSSSADFLGRVQPRLAVISVGRRNRFGHPSSEVLQRIEEARAEVLRTDAHGLVSITLDPSLTLRTHHPRTILELR